MQKRIYILPLPSKLRADRPSLYIRVELCIWTSLILDMLLIATRLVFIFSRMLSMKRGHAKQTSIVNDTSKDKVLACSGKRKKKSVQVQLKTALEDRTGIRHKSVISKPALLPLNHVGPSWAKFQWLHFHILYTI